MFINKNDISVNDAYVFADTDNLLLKRRENNLLLSDYQISVLNRNGINYKLFESTKKLLFEIEKCLDDDYDEELDLIGSQLSEYIYYNETKK